jgi:hypothetical protein
MRPFRIFQNINGLLKECPFRFTRRTFMPAAPRE